MRSGVAQTQHHTAGFVVRTRYYQILHVPMYHGLYNIQLPTYLALCSDTRSGRTGYILDTADTGESKDEDTATNINSSSEEHTDKIEDQIANPLQNYSLLRTSKEYLSSTTAFSVPLIPRVICQRVVISTSHSTQGKDQGTRREATG